MAVEEPGGGPAEDAPPAPAKSGRGRRWSVRAIIVLASILLGLGVLATWIDRVALTSSSYADTSE
jgi:TRAP-type mannitol/chloroaromatic compound transport system permease small subunit